MTFSVMFADADRKLVDQLKNKIQAQDDMTWAGQVETDTEILPLLHHSKPDVLVMDLFYPPSRGLAILAQLQEQNLGYPAATLVVSNLDQDDLTSAAAQLGAAFFLLKPFQVEVFLRRVRQTICPHVSIVADTAQRYEQQLLFERIAGHFASLGIPPHYKGYRYLQEAVALALEDRSWLRSMTKRLYPEIAARTGTKPSQVERAIRHALDITWERGSMTELGRLFPYSVDAEKGRPTNSSFIAKMIDILRFPE